MANHAFVPKLLVIDDEEAIRDGVSQLFSRQGFEVDAAVGGRQGLAKLRENDFHVVLLDLRMPDLEGDEVLRRIKAENLDVDVIMITGHGTIEQAVAAMKSGAYDFITKPFVPWQLKQVVGRAVEARRLKAERDRLARERERGLWEITTEKTRLKAVINSMHEGVLIADPDLRVVLCNPALSKMMGLEQAPAAGAGLGQEPALAPLVELAEELLEAEEELAVITRELAHAEDRPAHLRASISHVQNERGETLGLVTVLEDVSAFKELERKKSEFVAMVTHELRSPLGAIDTQLKVLLRGLAGELNQKQQHLFGRMQKRLGGVVDLITDLLDLSKIEAQSFVQQKKTVDLGPLVEEACGLLRPNAQEKELVLELSLAPELPQILADPDSLKEVATNLISNAIRYTPQGGRVKVATEFDGSYVHLVVSDTGIGIDPADQERIFDKFYRVKSEQTRYIVGTGLGLPIVKAIVDDHLGSVEVESKPGQGATFRVKLPMMV